MVCFTWSRIIREFSRLIGWQYDQLREMEKHIKGSFKMHTREWDEFYKPTIKSKRSFSFSNLEAQMPSIFIGLYVIYAIGIVIAVTRGLL